MEAAMVDQLDIVGFKVTILFLFRFCILECWWPIDLLSFLLSDVRVTFIPISCGM